MRSLWLVLPWLLLPFTPATAAEQTFLTPPVDAAIAGRFDDPAHPYGAGHRGIDYAAPEGTAVRAAGSGTVTYAGSLPTGMAVTVDHGAGLETTYSRLSSVWVSEGEEVTEGSWVGRSGSAHGEESPGLHFGVKVDGAYVDPLTHLGPLDSAGAIALAPLSLDPIEDRHVRSCRTSGDLPENPSAPNDNVVVAIGGITSSTEGSDGPDIYRAVSNLGYSSAKTYRFSYEGANGPGFHEPYSRWDTFGDLRDAAERLRDLMERIALTHPGSSVDLVAHSQGGIVGRTYLTEQAQAWDEDLPRVEHFVTFATPHRGVPAAAEIDELYSGPIPSRLIPPVMDEISERTGLVPGTDSEPLHQLRVGSDLISSLAEQDVMFGTKVLALGVPNDIIVPAPRATYPGKPSRTVPVDGIFGHSAIVRSPHALQIAHGFLGGAGPSCQAELGPVESRLGRIIDGGQSLIGEAANAFIDGIWPGL